LHQEKALKLFYDFKAFSAKYSPAGGINRVSPGKNRISDRITF
jgi:hypothetical protein